MSKKDLIEFINNASSHEIDFLSEIVKNLDGSHLRYFDKLIGIKRNENVTLKPGINNKNIYGVVHGGAICSLIDIALGAEIFKTIGTDKKIYTLELKVNFTKATSDSELKTQTKILHLGSTTIVAQCLVVDDSEDIVAVGLGTFYIVQ
ncbi:PaaI family thioesterase [Desulfurella sp.]|uniref:PaaI family thioesterase n=1 Tax=Desulfurella sp. TaxID=1962857 RepID=UPI0025C39821|nr:PaaI family thioesterase [Desulfurella sp.]